ncbi:substrate-binding domain-containing protein [Nocardia neocaledoniensis]|uniref:substrate-binding domain-containing protein n=1 Tax=Nocardia neocaledoniensis TaxID=236511 RepID=UPI002454EE0B|nr:substrate-binding domain-containing protein [Nocardia neocaledoniensis]
MRAFLTEAMLVLDAAGYHLITQLQAPAGAAQPPPHVLTAATVTNAEAVGVDALPLSRVPGVPFFVLRWDDRAVMRATISTRLQVTHLYDCGHRRVAFAAPSDQRRHALVAERSAQAQHTATALGLEPIRVHTIDSTAGSAARAIRQLRNTGTTAVAAFDDEIAAVIAGAAQRAGLSVPGDLAVVGHDDSPTAEVFSPPLSSIRIDHRALGRYLAGLLLHKMDGAPRPAAPEYSAVLTVRESTIPR